MTSATCLSQAKIRTMSSKMTQATQSASLAVKLAPEKKIAEYLAQCPEEAFNVEHQRKLKDLTLPLAEENLITALSVDGNSAWSQLYTSISSTMSCQVFHFLVVQLHSSAGTSRRVLRRACCALGEGVALQSKGGREGANDT